jgi:hypothetical protein
VGGSLAENLKKAPAQRARRNDLRIDPCSQTVSVKCVLADLHLVHIILEKLEADGTRAGSHDKATYLQHDCWQLVDAPDQQEHQ